MCATRGHPRGSSPYLSRLTPSTRRPLGGFTELPASRAERTHPRGRTPIALARKGATHCRSSLMSGFREEGTLSRRGFFSSLRDVGSNSIHPDEATIRLRLTQTPWKKTHHPCQCSHQTSPPGWQRWHQHPAYWSTWCSRRHTGPPSWSSRSPPPRRDTSTHLGDAIV